MPIGNLDRYFELGARCLTCGWRGTVGALVSRGSEPANSPLHCPSCDGQQTEWPLATHDVHETAQYGQEADMQVTDEMCERAILAAVPGRFGGFATPQDALRSKWGPPYYIVDHLIDQELRRGDDHDEMMRRLEIEKMRCSITAAIASASPDTERESN